LRRMKEMRTEHIFIVFVVLTAMTIIGSIASEQGWIISTKEETDNSKYLDPSTTKVNVTSEEAKAILISENPGLYTNSINAKLLKDNDFGIIWHLTAKTSNNRSVLAGIDPDNGNIVFIYDGSKKTRGDNRISEEEAVKIAEKYMETALSANQLKEVQFDFVNYQEPVADDLPGFYHIRYNRIIKGIASLSDGVTMRVNSETGDVSSYREQWKMPEEKIYAIDTEAIIIEEKAAETLKEFIANEVYDGKISSTTEIITSKLVWKSTENEEIHLAWWMQFTDPNLGLDESLPGMVCIDANSGEVLMSSYAIG
jgi:hypothetical protein